MAIDSDLELEIENYMAMTEVCGTEMLGPDTNKRYYEHRRVEQLEIAAKSKCLFPDGCDMEMFKKKKTTTTPLEICNRPLRIAKSVEEVRLMRDKRAATSDTYMNPCDTLSDDVEKPACDEEEQDEMQEFLNNDIPLTNRREEINVRIAANQAERAIPGSSRQHDVIGERICDLKTIDEDMVKKEYELQRRVWCKNRRFIRRLSMSWKIPINHLIAKSRPPPRLATIRESSEPVLNSMRINRNRETGQQLERVIEPAMSTISSSMPSKDSAKSKKGGRSTSHALTSQDDSGPLLLSAIHPENSMKNEEKMQEKGVERTTNSASENLDYDNLPLKLRIRREQKAARRTSNINDEDAISDKGIVEMEE